MNLIQNNICCDENGECKRIVAIDAPLYRRDAGEEFAALPFIKEENGGYLFGDDDCEVFSETEALRESLFLIRRKWKNRSAHAISIQTMCRVTTSYHPQNWVIPCVSINGNEFGGGSEPKGLTHNGEKWIFAYDRTSIPACTLTENDSYACGLFASNENTESLISSCSLTQNSDGTFSQEVIHPMVEAPLTYCDRDRYGPAYHTYITLNPGESVQLAVYLSVTRPRWKNYGMADLVDVATELFGDNSDMAIPKEEDVWHRSIEFAKSLITSYKGKPGFIIGFRPNEADGFSYRTDNCFELAWCGQNVLYARMLIEDYIRFGHRDSLEEALKILDTRVALCTAENGLLASQLKSFENLNDAQADTCNMGYGAYEFLRCYARLAEIGIDKPLYLAAGKGLCDFFCEHYSEEYGFGKEWRLDGTCLDQAGSIGGFVICALAKMYAISGESKYLKTAENAMHLYTERDLDRFVCTAGALDTSCVDKETSAPFVISGVLLYMLTGDGYYRTVVEKAAYYFTSWMYTYEPVYDLESDFTQYGIRVKGMTSVSAQHHHLDLYAGLLVPYLEKLAVLTGESCWKDRADMMRRAVMQQISDGTYAIHGRVRPIGSQNEAYFHCRWGFGGYPAKRGSMNDWLVAWPGAFRLAIIAHHNHPDF